MEAQRAQSTRISPKMIAAGERAFWRASRTLGRIDDLNKDELPKFLSAIFRAMNLSDKNLVCSKRN
jgi:hypothetical protein